MITSVLASGSKITLKLSGEALDEEAEVEGPGEELAWTPAEPGENSNTIQSYYDHACSYLRKQSSNEMCLH